MLPRRELLDGSRWPEALAAVLERAETCLRTWEPVWSDFLDGGVREEALERLAGLAELELHSEGGYAGAERQRLLILRRDAGLEASSLEPPISGLQISGNFLFDPADPQDLRQALESLLQELGLGGGAIGDVWLRGDRGGQALVDTAAAAALEGRSTMVRSVEVLLEPCEPAALQPPARRQPRRLQTVEASCRLDAVASAGFGLARSRMADLIRSGQVRLNWSEVSSPSRELVAGDRVQLAGKGELEVLAIEATKRERWRIELMRR
jgi:photosystem II S4 domain protein